MKKFQRHIESLFYWALLGVCTFISRNLARRNMYRFSELLGILLYGALKKHREAAVSGLTHAFNGSMTGGQIKRLARDCFISMAKSGAEMVFFIGKPAQIRENVRIEGEEHLQKALALGRGVVLVSAHFGNFPLMLARLCLQGYRTSVIMRPLREKRIENVFVPESRRVGLIPIYSIPRRECVQRAIKTLRKNELLFVPIDQNFGTGGVYVDFFGRKAATATGPVVFAERTGAAVIPCFIVRHPDNSHTIRIEPMLELKRNGDQESFVRAELQKITDIIESYIRQYPQEWSWIHRRWKSRPPEKGRKTALQTV